MPDEYEELAHDLEALEGDVDDLRTIAARLEGEMIHIRRGFEVQERLDAERVSAALEVRKAEALELIRENGAKRNHRRELIIKAMATITVIATAIAAYLGS